MGSLLITNANDPPIKSIYDILHNGIIIPFPHRVIIGLYLIRLNRFADWRRTVLIVSDRLKSEGREPPKMCCDGACKGHLKWTALKTGTFGSNPRIVADHYFKAVNGKRYRIMQTTVRRRMGTFYLAENIWPLFVKAFKISVAYRLFFPLWFSLIGFRGRFRYLGRRFHQVSSFFFSSAICLKSSLIVAVSAACAQRISPVSSKVRLESA